MMTTVKKPTMDIKALNKLLRKYEAEIKTKGFDNITKQVFESVTVCDQIFTGNINFKNQQ